jgi:molecular chaperone GrpE
MANKHSHDPAGPAPAVSDPPQAEEAAAAPAETEATGVAALTRERDDFYERLLRKTAEFDNYRKRIERERREQSDQAIVDLLEELLLVVDDFDLALRVEAGEGASSYTKGVELIHAKLQDLLRKQGVGAIEALGADFDPNLHQAVMHEVSPEHREGEVIGELRRGYTIGDRLLRPAMVKVAKA